MLHKPGARRRAAKARRLKWFNRQKNSGPVRKNRHKPAGIRRLAGLCLLPAVFAAPPSGFAAAPAVQIDTLRPVGQASLRILWFYLYDATLLTATGEFDDKAEPLAITIRYRRKVARERLVSETAKQLQGKLSPAVLQRGLEQLATLWPDIDVGDTLTFYLENSGLGHFYYNAAYLGSVEEPAFARAFIDIWIGADSAYPKLAARLTGR